MSFRRGGAPEYHWIWQQHLSHLEFSITLCNCNWDTVSLKLTLGNGWFKSTEDGSQKHGNVTNSNPTWNQYLKHAQMILLWQRHWLYLHKSIKRKLFLFLFLHHLLCFISLLLPLSSEQGPNFASFFHPAPLTFSSFLLARFSDLAQEFLCE